MAELFYLVILIVGISLVYAGTRYEALDAILNHALKTIFWFGGGLLLVHLILYVAAWWAG